MSPANKSDPSVGELLTALARDTGTLVKQEVELAALEANAKAKRAAQGAGVVLAGGLVIHLGMVVLAISLVWGLASFVQPWVSALIVGLVAAIGGYVLVSRGLAILHGIDPVPRHTKETLKADARWAKEQVR